MLKNIVKVILAGLVCLPVFASANINDIYSAQMERVLDAVKSSPTSLHSFMVAMPKGGDLHDHLTGSITPDLLFSTASSDTEDSWCADPQTWTIMQNPQCVKQDDVLLKDATQQQKLMMSEAWSMENYPLTRPQFALSHFFDYFTKTSAMINNTHLWSDYLTSLTKQATDEHMNYLEFQLKPDSQNIHDPSSSDYYGSSYLQDFPTDADDVTYSVVANAIQTLNQHNFEVALVKPDVIAPLQSAYDQANLHGITVRFLYHALRDDPIGQVFANFYAGFLACKDAPNLFVGINLVEEEGNATADADYDAQMKIVKYMQEYFNNTYHMHVHVTLHAGELTPQILINAGLPQHTLYFHVNDAVNIAGAERIGHGDDVNYEKSLYPDLLAQMKNKHVMVEVNLTSNQDTMGICDGQSYCEYKPVLPAYLQAGVPVALSTDDEGVELINLSDEYTKAESWFGIDYAALKDMDRNSLIYSFIPGGQLWAKYYDFTDFVPACSADNPYGSTAISSRCQTYLDQNLKAQLEWNLEEQFATFEKARVQ